MPNFDFLTSTPDFASFVSAERLLRIDASVLNCRRGCSWAGTEMKSAIQKSLDKLETLKRALMKKHFG